MLRAGSIIRAAIADPQGSNEKTRPLVVISVDDNDLSLPVVAVAITSRFTEPLLADEVRLPFHPQGLAKSSLRVACVAKCTWIRRILRSDIVETKGFLPADVVAEILARIPAVKD